MNLILTAVILGLIVAASNLVLAFVFFRRYRQEKTAFLLALRAYFESPNSDTPSEFGRVLVTLSDTMASRIVLHAKTAFMGKASGEVRQQKAIDLAIAKDQAAGDNPLAAAALEAIKPNSYLGKLINGNPAIMAMVGKMFSKGGTSAPDNGKPKELVFI